jgi:hypothetical protein
MRSNLSKEEINYISRAAVSFAKSVVKKHSPWRMPWQLITILNDEEVAQFNIVVKRAFNRIIRKFGYAIKTDEDAITELSRTMPTSLIQENNQKPPKYKAPSRKGKKSLLLHLDQDTYEAFSRLGKTSGLTNDYLAHKAMALLLDDAGEAVPASTREIVADAAPKKPGPQRGRPRAAKKALGD